MQRLQLSLSRISLDMGLPERWVDDAVETLFLEAKAGQFCRGAAAGAMRGPTAGAVKYVYRENNRKSSELWHLSEIRGVVVVVGISKCHSKYIRFMYAARTTA
jgi:hypothetical protein